MAYTYVGIIRSSQSNCNKCEISLLNICNLPWISGRNFRFVSHKMCRIIVSSSKGNFAHLVLIMYNVCSRSVSVALAGIVCINVRIWIHLKLHIPWQSSEYQSVVTAKLTNAQKLHTLYTLYPVHFSPFHLENRTFDAAAEVLISMENKKSWQKRRYEKLESIITYFGEMS